MRRRPELAIDECATSEGVHGKRAKCYQSQRVLPSLTLLIKSCPRSKRDYQRPAREDVSNDPSNHVSESLAQYYALTVDNRHSLRIIGRLASPSNARFQCPRLETGG